MKRVFLVCALFAACKSSSDSKPSGGSAPPAGSSAGSSAKPTTGSATGSAAGSSAATGSATPGSAEPPKAMGVDLAGMNKAVAPGDDFYAYANGTWIDKTEIPADRSGWGTGGIIVELTAKRTRELIEQAAQAADGSEARKVGDYYAAFMDENGIESKGLAPLKPALDAIGKISDAKTLATALGGTIRADVDAINNTNFQTRNVLGLWVAQDFVDPTKYAAFLMQGGLVLPDRDYYLDTDARSAELRTKYQAHVAAMLAAAGVADGAAVAKRVVELETKIAKTHATRTESTEVKLGLTHWPRKDFATKAPGLDWDALFAGAGLDKQDTFVVWHPKAVTGLAALVKSEPLATWKEYLTFHAIEAAAPYLPKKIVDEDFSFHGATLSGAKQLADRWKRGVGAANDAMSHAVGKLYVAKYFPPSEKARAEEMVKNELAAMSKRIDKLAWMAPATKEKAKAKLAVLKVGVGYPDTWRDYGGLQVVAGDPLGNAQRAEMWEYKRNLAKLGTPVDRSEWVMEPQLVNAVNLPAMNSMNFPAAILQPPYFDPNRPSAMDFGAIGAVIGHEISHSFDDQGALFDATGKLANWWTPEDFKHFEESGKKLVAQYDTYKPFPDVHVNGQLTLGENIADVAGLAVAYDAWKSSGAKDPTVDGLTPDQQFFLSFAQSWRAKYRSEALRNRIKTDGHSPSEYRGDTVRNLDAWYAAFDVKSGKLFLKPEDRVRIW